MRTISITGGGSANIPDAVVDISRGQALFINVINVPWATNGRYLTLRYVYGNGKTINIPAPYVSAKATFFIPNFIINNNDANVLISSGAHQNVTFYLINASNTPILLGSSKLLYAGVEGLGNRLPAIPVFFGYTNSADFGKSEMRLANNQLRNSTFRSGNIRYIRDVVGVGSKNYEGGRNLSPATNNENDIIGNWGKWRSESNLLLSPDRALRLKRDGGSPDFGIKTPLIARLKAGTYTISFEIASNYSTLSYNYNYILSTEGSMAIASFSIPISLDYQYITITFTTAIDRTNIQILIGSSILYSDPEQGFKIKNLKIEEGATATPWTPAPEDGYQKPQWAEIQVLDAGGTNVALSKTVTADFTAESGRPLTRVTDGDLTLLTRPNTQDNKEHYVQVDLGSARTINKIIVNHGSGGAYNNRTMVSSNGTDWVEVNNVMGWSPSTPKTIDLNQATYTPAGGGTPIPLGKIDIFTPQNIFYETFRLENGGHINQYGQQYQILPICKDMIQLVWATVGSETLRSFWFSPYEVSRTTTKLADVRSDNTIAGSDSAISTITDDYEYSRPSKSVRYTSGFVCAEILEMLQGLMESPIIFRYVPESQRYKAEYIGGCYERINIKRDTATKRMRDDSLGELLFSIDESSPNPQNVIY